VDFFSWTGRLSYNGVAVYTAASLNYTKVHTISKWNFNTSNLVQSLNSQEKCNLCRTATMKYTKMIKK